MIGGRSVSQMIGECSSGMAHPLGRHVNVGAGARQSSAMHRCGRSTRSLDDRARTLVKDE
eukprot:5472394-Prymnesium_polylepis.1